MWARAILSLALPAMVAVKATAATDRPNLVFVLVDDLGWADVSFRSGDKGAARTPVFEKLLAEGINLNRHYAYSWCAPSRASVMSGRLPVHVNVNHTDNMALNVADPVSGSGGIPTKMSLVSDKLKEAGYSTHYNGKWGVGFARREQMPLARGYDSFFGYLMDSNDYWDSTVKSSSVEIEKECELNGINGIRDLTFNDGPARGLNGTGWEDYLFLRQSLRVIDEHDPAAGKPLFLFHAFHSVHTPLDPPEELSAPFAHIANPTRRAYLAMTNFVDTSVGKLVDALKGKGMWDNTLLVLSSDNGGPIYPGKSLKMFGGASNLPLRGGKSSDWEGGIRVNAFVSGGLVPPEMRGKELDDYFHIADWYATFCALAGIDPTDKVAAQYGLPPIDSINQWPLLSGAVSTGSRKGMQISPKTLIEGRWKLLTGSDEGNINPYQSPTKVSFNVYSVGYGLGAFKSFLVPGRECAQGCLYDILADPTESKDVAEEHPDVVQTLMTRLQKLNKKVFDPKRGTFLGVDVCKKLQKIGYYGPIDGFLDSEKDKEGRSAPSYETIYFEEF